MKYFSIKKINKTIAFLLSSLIIKGALAFQHTSPDDYATVQQWIKNTDFETHSINDHGLPLTDLQSNVLVALHALHTSRTERFYEYLAQVLIVEMDQDEPLLSLLLKSELNLHTPLNRAFESLIVEKNEAELAHWLHDYIGLENHLARNKKFASFCFLLLTKATTSKLQWCPAASILGHFKSAKEKRRSLLQCLTKIINVNIIDIDISKHRVVSTRILSKEPASSEIDIPLPVMVDDSESHLVDVLSTYNNPDLTPIILLTSLTGNEFITPLGVKPESTPMRVKTNRDKQSDPDNTAKKEDKRIAFLKSDNLHWLSPWIKSPGYSTALWLAFGTAVVFFIAHAPYPANPFLAAARAAAAAPP